MPNSGQWDMIVLVGATLAFALPLTLLIPNFSVWTVVPKMQITRFHVFSQSFTWGQLNSVIIALLILLFCLILELRKRKLDEIVQRVLLVREVSDKIAEAENVKQAAAMATCVDLLDVSTEHYEHLVLLRDDLRRRERCAKQIPPAIQASSQYVDNAYSK